MCHALERRKEDGGLRLSQASAAAAVEYLRVHVHGVRFGLLPRCHTVI